MTRRQPLSRTASGIEEGCFVHSIDELMACFVVWHGEVPLEAKPIADWAARAHASSWIRRNIGKGIVQSYVAGYALEHRWWTFFFNRLSRTDVVSEQIWSIEAYNNQGPSWSDTFLFWPYETCWRHSEYLARGDNFGRHVFSTDLEHPAQSRLVPASSQHGR
jgi:hypothetical protein